MSNFACKLSGHTVDDTLAYRTEYTRGQRSKYSRSDERSIADAHRGVVCAPCDQLAALELRCRGVG
jgi:hypothetical protein